MKFIGKVSGLVLLLLFLVYIPTNAQSTDRTAPKITKISIVNQEVSMPGTVYVDVSFIEEGVGVKVINIYFRYVGKDADISDNVQTFVGSQSPSHDYPLFTQTVRIAVTIPLADYGPGGMETYPDGKWCIDTIYITDCATNTQSISYKFNAATLAEEGIEVETNGRIDQRDYGLNPEYPTFTVKNKLIQLIHDMPEHSTITIPYEDNAYPVIPKGAFDALKGKDKMIILNRYTDEYQWIINGKDITKATKDVDTQLSAQRQSGLAHGSSADIIRLYIDETGTFPGKVRIRMKSDYLYDIGKSGKLYLYYQKGNLLTEEAGNFALVFDGIHKWCEFDITRNSKLFISSQKLTFPVSLKVTYKKNKATGGKVPADRKPMFDIYSGKYLISAVGNTGKLVRKGYIFAGWNTKANGTGTNYKKGKKVYVKSQHTVLYAKWNKAKLTSSSRTVRTGKKLTLTAAKDKGSAIQSVKWSASNKKAAVKTSKTKCILTGKKKGKVTLKAVITFQDGSKQTLKRKITRL